MDLEPITISDTEAAPMAIASAARGGQRLQTMKRFRIRGKTSHIGDKVVMKRPSGIEPPPVAKRPSAAPASLVDIRREKKARMAAKAMARLGRGGVVAQGPFRVEVRAVTSSRPGV